MHRVNRGAIRDAVSTVLAHRLGELALVADRRVGLLKLTQTVPLRLAHTAARSSLQEQYTVAYLVPACLYRLCTSVLVAIVRLTSASRDFRTISTFLTSPSLHWIRRFTTRCIWRTVPATSRAVPSLCRSRAGVQRQSTYATLLSRPDAPVKPRVRRREACK